MVDAFADAVGPLLPATELPTHLKLVRFILGIQGVLLAIFGFASVGSAISGEHPGAGLTLSLFGLGSMAFAGTWPAFLSAPFGVASAVVGWRLTMAPQRLRAAAAVCLGWAVVSLLISVEATDARVIAAVVMVLMAGSLLNAIRDPRNAVLSARPGSEGRAHRPGAT